MTTSLAGSTNMIVRPIPDQLMEAAARLNIAGFEQSTAYRVVYPKGDSEEAVQHGAARMRKEAATLGAGSTDSPKVWHMMVVDELDPAKIMCLGIWFYVAAAKPGDADPSDSHQPPPDANPEAFELAAHGGTQRRKDLMRSQGIGDYLFLASLTTAQEARKKGAATLMLKWGKDLATRLRVPCFLQASQVGEPLYIKLGWQTKGILSLDFSKWKDGSDSMLTNTLMLWWPDGTEAAEM